VGYCTLYGDMVARWRDWRPGEDAGVCGLPLAERDRELIPGAILEKPPSAELRPDQKDTDSLPPYEVLDPILEAYVERYENPRTHCGSKTSFHCPSSNRWCGWVEAIRVQAPASRSVLKVIQVLCMAADSRIPVKGRGIS